MKRTGAAAAAIADDVASRTIADACAGEGIKGRRLRRRDRGSRQPESRCVPLAVSLRTLAEGGRRLP